MKKMKKLAALSLALVMGLSLVACGKDERKDDSSSSSSSQDGGSGEAAAPEISGTAIDTGMIKAMVPEGWLGIEVHDLFSDDPEAKDPRQLQIAKGAETKDDLWNSCYIQINYYPPTTEMISAKSYYDDAVDIDPFDLGQFSWTGYTCTSMGYEYTILEGTKDKENLQLSILTKSGDKTIALSDADVQYIITNLETTPPAE